MKKDMIYLVMSCAYSNSYPGGIKIISYDKLSNTFSKDFKVFYTGDNRLTYINGCITDLFEITNTKIAKLIDKNCNSYTTLLYSSDNVKEASIWMLKKLIYNFDHAYKDESISSRLHLKNKWLSKLFKLAPEELL